MTQIRIGLVGTSWWAESMYLPALATHPHGRITALCGRNADRAREVAGRWNISTVYDDAASMYDDVDAVIVASSNASHHPLALAALQRGKHVLCEKPLGLSGAEADELASAASAAGVVTMTPFTYRFMPMMVEMQHRVSSGFVGSPYHMAARYYTGFARDGEYSWRFDRAEAGSGVLGDLGSHWIDLAIFLLGPITHVGAVTNSAVPRAARPDGTPYDTCEDVAMMTVRFASGAIGQLIVSAVAWEATAFGQTHHVEVHGSDGTLYAYSDWDSVQEVRGLRNGERGPAQPLDRTPSIWSGLRTDTVHNTYRDVFRTTDAMSRGWVTAIAEGRPCQPDLAHGALVQRITDAAVRSAQAAGALVSVT
ncbi:MAG: Gfo/Idh/MocA family protein [Ilumatobacteraceae bacterium]